MRPAGGGPLVAFWGDVSGERWSIRDTPAEERPRERMVRLGAGALSVVELLTVLVGSGTRDWPADRVARRVAAAYPSLRSLAARGPSDLAALEGVGTATATRLTAACELARRLQRERRDRQPVLATPRSVWRHFSLELRDRERERFIVLCLNARNELMREIVVSMGSLNASIVHPREVYKPALGCSAAAIIVVHNHPSGDPAPSREDRQVTRAIDRAGRLLDVPLHDHVIVGADSYFSFRDAGLL